MNSPIAILVRHGEYQQLPETPSAHQPFGLNEAGFKQAQEGISKVKDILSKNGWLVNPIIHSSNLLRAWQTAEIIKNGLGLSGLQGFDSLAERGLGSAANLTTSHIESILKDDPRFETPPANWKSDSHYRLPLQGAESLMDAGKRVAAHIAQIKGVQIIVGHGAAFRHGAHILGALEFGEIAKMSMYHAHPVVLAKTNEGNWQKIAGDWKIRKPREEFRD